MVFRPIAGWALAAVVSLGLSLSACGPKIPDHAGYKSTKPWKKAKKLKFDEDREAVADGTVSYPKRERSRWYVLDLDTDGELTIKMEGSPIGTGRPDMTLGFEILDKGYNLVMRRYPDPNPEKATAKSKSKSKKAADDDDDDDDEYDDDDDDDEYDDFDDEGDEESEGEMEWEQTLVELRRGRYFIHVYAMGRMDEADFSMRLKHKTGAEIRESNFPANVAYLDPLPMVPPFDDTPSVDCKSCDCKSDSRCKSGCSKCERRTPRPRVDCDKCDCSGSCARSCRSKCGGDETPAAGAMSARVVRMVSAGGGTKVTLNRGSSNGITSGWKGKITDAKGKAINNGSFTVENVGTSTCEGTVGASLDTVRAAGRAKLTPP